MIKEDNENVSVNTGYNQLFTNLNNEPCQYGDG